LNQATWPILIKTKHSEAHKSEKKQKQTLVAVLYNNQKQQPLTDIKHTRKRSVGVPVMVILR